MLITDLPLRSHPGSPPQSGSPWRARGLGLGEYIMGRNRSGRPAGASGGPSPRLARRPSDPERPLPGISEEVSVRWESEDPIATQCPDQGCFSLASGRREERGGWCTPAALHAERDGGSSPLPGFTQPTSCAATGTELWRHRPFLSFLLSLSEVVAGGEAESADPAAMLVKKHAGKGGGREPGSEDPSPAGQRCVRAIPPCAVLAALLSVVAVVSCLYLGVKTNDLQARIAALESAKGAPSIRLLPETLDQLKAVVQERVERLLAQKSYEHMGKIRIAREAPSECNCPAVDKEHWEPSSQPKDVEITKISVSYSSVVLPAQGIRCNNLHGVMDGERE
ncbi:uncharacterized protein LOC110594643 [Carlito syrichta]|uniref:Uncharacterized protein LOC110594643 n=1 Tax=Carlito syrichta TaxID=1868482 RepID=A0A3Q0DMR0_CARSF|nr:uncharacterized protein LOC110594643 [Carlito syrichta]